jgi:hypothetical protein
MGWGFLLISRQESVFWGTIGSFIGMIFIRVARYFTPARSWFVAILGWIFGLCAIPLLVLVIGLILIALGYIPSECLKSPDQLCLSM